MLWISISAGLIGVFSLWLICRHLKRARRHDLDIAY